MICDFHFISFRSAGHSGYGVKKVGHALGRWGGGA
jgi:hypothetical protein